MYDVTSIKNYILFLRNKHNLSVTLHPAGYDRIISHSELMSFNIHDNSHCIYVKTCAEAQKYCVERQCKVHSKAEHGPFPGICYAGVKEFVYPIYDRSNYIGFISVSGYSTENGLEYLHSVAEKYDLSFEKMKETYASLRKITPDEPDVNALIIPLCNMLELAYIKTEDKIESDTPFAEKVIRYIKTSHNQTITSKDICTHFSCSRSYLSSHFNKYTGKTLREYINELRVEDAKTLLQHSKLTITEIAYSIGFTDSNYFSSQFKSLTGHTPSEFRRKNI